MASLGSRALNAATWVNISGTAVVGSDPVLETISGAVDGSYAHTASNATATYEGYAQFSPPSDLATMTTLSIQLRYHWQTGTQVNTWNSLTARIYKSDGVTPLTNEATLASSITTTTPTNSSVIAFTGVDTAATLSDWQNARVYIRWSITKSMSGDTLEKRVTAGELTGTYEIAGVTGTANITLGTLTAAGTGSSPITGTSAVTLGTLTAAGTGSSPITGTSSVTLGTLTVSGTANAIAGGTLSTTLGTLTVSGTGTVADTFVYGTANITLGALTLSGTGSSPIIGTATPTLGTLTLSSTGSAPIIGTSNVTLGTLTVSGTGTAQFQNNGTANITLGTLTAAGTGSAPITGTGAVTLGALTSAGTGSAPITGNATRTLGTLTLSATGASNAPVVGNANITLGAMSVMTSNGHVPVLGTAEGMASRGQHLRFKRNAEYTLTGKLTKIGMWPKGTVIAKGDAVVVLKGVQISFRRIIEGWYWGTPIDRAIARPRTPPMMVARAGNFVQTGEARPRVGKIRPATSGTAQPWANQKIDEGSLVVLATLLADSLDPTKPNTPPQGRGRVRRPIRYSSEVMDLANEAIRLYGSGR